MALPSKSFIFPYEWQGSILGWQGFHLSLGNLSIFFQSLISCRFWGLNPLITFWTFSCVLMNCFLLSISRIPCYSWFLNRRQFNIRDNFEELRVEWNMTAHCCLKCLRKSRQEILRSSEFLPCSTYFSQSPFPLFLNKSMIALLRIK